MYNIVFDRANPQRRKADKAEPSADMRITVVMCRWSVSDPISIVPTTEAQFKIDTVIVPSKDDRPMDAA